jgi:oligoribonuclease NrnB/cAMP/cGMP phosphodiesterase (DHH superfamily)
MLVPPIINAGYSIVTYKEAQYESIRKSAFVVDTEFGRCVCINTDAGSSKVFGDLLKQYDFGCMFRYNGKIWINQLRSDETSDINVAEIAAKFGGGGHAHAAGFTSETCKWCG